MEETRAKQEGSSHQASDLNHVLEADSNKLIIKNHIASGSFGSVYKGVYDGKQVAVKVLDMVGDYKARVWNAFIQEVLIWNKLDHPNIARFIGATKKAANLTINKQGRGKSCMPRMACCMVAEYVHGGTLRSFLRRKRCRKLPLDTVIWLALEVAKGLSYLHSQKIVHRDVKPENILLDKEGRRAKIIDFGVSRFEDLNPGQMTSAQGTVGYMAPEVLVGSPYDHKCDVFSFGICLWEIYCCDKPDFSTSFRPIIPQHCPRNLSRLMERCWDADPKRRPEMAEVVNVLESLDTSQLPITKACNHSNAKYHIENQFFIKDKIPEIDVIANIQNIRGE
ncbi:serine/threonine-protein kinase STY13-like [Coffea eugenioides]|uniref:Serine/threonine-protein kinase 54-like n=1 Tax=Coffea arabica TaxID=13443 RepID=A0A6P6TL65_COFAR|nr:serine/threonine-protein kinase STY13-like [Coffea arabica]XP_027179042.1 serine/threonine-protein kinase STY13-like [Coffea eugenioides]